MRYASSVVSAEKLLALIDGLGGIVWEADPETFQFSFVSAEAERVLGYPVTDWLDQPDFWRRHTHPDDIARCARVCHDATRAGRDHQFDYRMIAADGHVVWLRDIVSVRNRDGVVRLVGIALDITREKQEESDRVRLAHLYEALIENTTDSIILLREDGTAIYASAAVEAHLGIPPHEIIGRNNFDLVHPDDLDVVRARFAEMLSGGGAVGPVRYRARHRDGRWVVAESVGKRFSLDESLVILNTRDVSDVVQTQQALEATQQQLAHAIKMEAIGRLAGGIAHDFNNLLTVIAGYADLVGATLPPSDTRAADMEEIRRAAHRATLLTRQLLAFSRKQVLRPEVLDVNVAVHEVGVMIRRLIGEDVQLTIDTTARPLFVLADRSQIEQVIVNLAVNARDAMPLGGTLRVSTRAHDGLVQLVVADTGSGITPEVMARIFEPFFTTKEMGKGTGLGLSTVYGIVKQSGGDIEVHSEPEKGTTFIVSLPEAAAPGERKPTESRVLPGGDETILLVEDERQVRELVDHVLTRLGYTVLLASDAHTAVELCLKHRPHRVALLLTDIVMPQISGPEVYKRISLMCPGIAVLYMSGYTDDRLFSSGVSEEGVAFLQKPFTPTALAQKVRTVLDDANRARRTG